MRGSSFVFYKYLSNYFGPGRILAVEKQCDIQDKSLVLKLLSEEYQ